MKFGINFQLQTPKPLDADQWHEHDELKIYHEALEQIEFADKLGYDYVFITEHHFLAKQKRPRLTRWPTMAHLICLPTS